MGFESDNHLTHRRRHDAGICGREGVDHAAIASIMPAVDRFRWTCHSNRSAIDLLTPNASLIVVVGDREQIEADIRSLDLGEVQVISDAMIQ